MTSVEGHSTTAKSSLRASHPALPNTHHGSYLLKWTVLTVPPRSTIHRDSPGQGWCSASFSSLIQILHSYTLHAFETLQGKSPPVEINKQMILNPMSLSHYAKCTIWAQLPTSQPQISQTVSPAAFAPVPFLPQAPIPSSLTLTCPSGWHGNINLSWKWIPQGYARLCIQCVPKTTSKELNIHFLGELPIATCKWNRFALNPDSKSKSKYTNSMKTET